MTRLSASESTVVAQVAADAWAADLDDGARCVLLALCATAQRAGRLDVTPNPTRLGARCGLSTGTARRQVSALRRLGYLVRPPREPGQRRPAGPRRWRLSTPTTERTRS